MVSNSRERALGRVVESLVAWARILHRSPVRPFGGRDLSRSQLDVLFLVAHSADPVTPAAVAEKLRITPGAVTQLVDGLKRNALISSAANPTDGRSRVLTLTAESTAHISDAEQAIIAGLRQRFDGLSDDELATLAELLNRTASLP